MKIFHAAILVPNIEKAIEAYRRSLQLDFLPPVSRSWPRVEQEGYDEPFNARITYSRQGPFYVELLETSGPGIWSAPTVDRFHHFGIWARDARQEGLRMEADGYRWEATIHADDGSTPVVFVRRGDVRVEIIDEARKPGIMAWIEGRADSPSPDASFSGQSHQ